MNGVNQKDFEQALHQCETEPIHQLGKIQPHGALLVFSSDNRHLVLQASTNVHNFIGLPVDGINGKPLAELFGVSAWETIERLIKKSKMNGLATGLINIPLGQQNVQLRARLFISAQMFVLELLHEADEDHDAQLTEMIFEMQCSLLTFNLESNLYQYFNQVTSTVSNLTGFDRVLVYRFEENWDGHVIAEKKVDDAPSYLGLRFPASDIPPQARHLYTTNLIRHIADIEAHPIEIFPALNPLTGLPLDLTYATLRGFSPIHVEYLRNMGVQASMSISLLQNGRLWGLIACHHLSPKQIPNTLFEAASFASQIVSAKLSLLEVNEQRNLNKEESRIISELMRSITTDGEEDIYFSLLSNLLVLLNASGVILVIEGEYHVHGEVPNSNFINDLLSWLGNMTAKDTFSCDCLAQHLPIASAYSEVAAGLLATPISSKMHNSIILLRKEKLRTVHWAGNSEKIFVKKTTGIQLSPRKSFETWTEAWRGRSDSWTRSEIEIAGSITLLITRGLTQKYNLEKEKEERRIADRKILQSELALYKSESWFKAVIESSDDAIVAKDLEGQIISWNPAAERMFGYSAQEAIGRFISFLYPLNSFDYKEIEFLDQIRYGNRISHYEAERVCKDGQIISVSISISPIRDMSGSIVGASKIIRDMSLQKRARMALERDNESLEALISSRTQELATARNAAESANIAKSSFVANMSHEIRTPLNAILGLSYMLTEANLPPDSAELVNKIRGAGLSLKVIINDILDFSKIEAGKVEIELAPFNLDELLERLATIMSVNIGEKDIETIIFPPPCRACHLIGDALRIEQVLTNLVSNAIKFTEMGQFDLKINLISAEENKVTLRFAVRDTGIGIATENQDKIFSAFSQEDVSITRRFGGTGLGLTICNSLITLMGGNLNVSSVLGGGSEFSFSLPFQREQKEGVPPPNWERFKVMIASDNSSVCEALSSIALDRGWIVNTTESSENVIQQILEQQIQQEPFRLILLDSKLSENGVLAVARSIHQATQAGNSPLVIVVTHSAHDNLMTDEDNRYIDAFLDKPVTATRLYKTVERALNVRQCVDEQVSKLTSQRLAGLRMLIVDDSDINLEVAQLIFAHEGAIVSLAHDGLQAVVWLQEHQNEIDIVLMDVQMPVMNGYEATRLIRKIPALSELPVVAVTAGVFDEQKELAIQAGMSSFLTKPFDVGGAIALIIKLTGHLTSVVSNIKLSSLHTVDNTDHYFPGIEVKRGLHVWKDSTTYRHYLRKFACDYDDILQQLKQSEKLSAAFLAHKLKGAAGSLALGDVSVIAGNLERALRASEDPAAYFASLSVALETTMNSIKLYAPPDTLSNQRSL